MLNNASAHCAPIHSHFASYRSTAPYYSTPAQPKLFVADVPRELTVSRGKSPNGTACMQVQPTLITRTIPATESCAADGVSPISSTQSLPNDWCPQLMDYIHTYVFNVRDSHADTWSTSTRLLQASTQLETSRDTKFNPNFFPGHQGIQGNRVSTVQGGMQDLAFETLVMYTLSESGNS